MKDHQKLVTCGLAQSAVAIDVGAGGTCGQQHEETTGHQVLTPVLQVSAITEYCITHFSLKMLGLFSEETVGQQWRTMLDVWR